jgi:hypothetical protein
VLKTREHKSTSLETKTPLPEAQKKWHSNLRLKNGYKKQNINKLSFKDIRFSDKTKTGVKGWEKENKGTLIYKKRIQ